MSAIDARFGHVNVTAHDWRRLAAFYTDVFGCELVPPERDIRSADLDAATGLRDAHLHRSPSAPAGASATPDRRSRSSSTTRSARTRARRVDRPGWGHIAFQVPDVPAAVDAVVAAGGARFGEIVAMRTKDGRTVTWVYTTDPDGNIVELCMASSENDVAVGCQRL